MSARDLVERILQSVPFSRLPVYKSITPPLREESDHVLEDWEFDNLELSMLPMPANVPRLPARVTAFTSAPWGRVGFFLVVFDDVKLPIPWDMWYLRDPSAKTGAVNPFFRTGDFDDAELLAWLVLKPFLQKQKIVIKDVVPPKMAFSESPWYLVRDVIRYRE